MVLVEVSVRRKLTTIEFVEKAQAVHGERYSYNLVEFKNTRTRVEIVCREHGSFFQTPSNHTNKSKKSGCPQCGAVVANNLRQLSTEQFIEKARATHGDKYDYSSTEYKGTHTKVEIVCKKHGSFLQAPSNHTNGGNGCFKCGMRLSTKEFIEKAKLLHGNLYDYSLTEYRSNKEKIIIVCKQHGSFLQTPGDHTSKRRHGCPKCSIITVADTRRLSTKEFIERAQVVHGDKYEYSLTEYKNNKEKVKITCRNHNTFEQTPSNHLAGSGCRKCGNSISKKEAAWLDQIEAATTETKGVLTEDTILLRQHKIGRYRVDGFNPLTNTVYEFLGDFWHGNPGKYPPEGINPISKKKYKTLYNEWLKRRQTLQEKGYTVIEMWESEFDNLTHRTIQQQLYRKW